MGPGVRDSSLIPTHWEREGPDLQGTQGRRDLWARLLIGCLLCADWLPAIRRPISDHDAMRDTLKCVKLVYDVRKVTQGLGRFGPAQRGEETWLSWRVDVFTEAL